MQEGIVSLTETEVVLMKDKTHLSIRMNSELHDKIQYVAAYEGRSMSGQIIYLLNKCVREFEEANGKIELHKEDV